MSSVKTLQKGDFSYLSSLQIRRFWSYVTKTDDCWPWTGSIHNTGYGRMKAKHKQVFVHRVSWEMSNGPIPNGMFVLHRCDNPPCVRPDHLFLGTKGDNNRDRVAKGRSAGGQLKSNKTHCPHGHPYSGDNLYVRPDQGRECRVCRRRRSITYYRKTYVPVRAS